MKIKLKSTLYSDSALFQSLFDIEIAIKIRLVHESFRKLPVTIILARRARLQRFWTEEVQAFSDVILSRTNPNNSVINSYYLTTVSIDQFR